MQSYLNLISYIQRYGESNRDPSSTSILSGYDRTGIATTSIFGHVFRHRMSDGFPLLTTKKVPLRWVFEELAWFLSGNTDERVLRQKSIDIWKEWATPEQCAKFGRQAHDLGPIYGSMWRGFPVGQSPDDNETVTPCLIVDQIEQLCNELRENPFSRRLIVSAWHPYYQKRVTLPPCHTLFQCKVYHPNENSFNKRRLSLTLYARSIDAFLGLPFNIASYALLLQLLAHTHGMMPEELVILFGDVHLYETHRDAVDVQLSRTPKQLPTIVIDKRLYRQGCYGLLDAKWSDITLINYNCYPGIEAPVAV